MTTQLGCSLQDSAAPEGVCFGCGTSNVHGLHVKSFWHEDGVHVIAEHLPDAKYCGWPDLVYGGLIAMLVDCHSNWTAMAFHYRAQQREVQPAADQLRHRQSGDQVHQTDPDGCAPDFAGESRR